MGTQPPFLTSKITGVILAGGQARRLGGAEKGLLELAGRPLVAWAIQALAPQVGTLLISANRQLETYRRFGHPVIPDQDPGFAGPLAGIASALTVVTTPWILCIPCDAPLAPRDLAARLAAALGGVPTKLAVAHDGTRLQPLHALIAVELAASLHAYLGAGKSAVHGWCQGHRPAVADFGDQAQAFTNLNTWEDLDHLERRLAG